jgi:peptidyl-prolyl cis-trans isomerase SurA
VSSTALYNAKLKTEDIEKMLASGEITFDEAVLKYSNDNSKMNGGLLLNPNTMSTLHTINDMEPALKYAVEKLDIGAISTSSLIQMPDETKAYRILRVNNKIHEHNANLVDNFSMIKEFAISLKKQDLLVKWIAKKISTTFVKINDDILVCEFKNKWVK